MAVATITIDQEVDVTLRITDRAGYPAKVDGVPAWSVQPEAVAELIPSADGMSVVIRSRDVVDEAAVVTVTADADLGAGVEPIIGVMSLAVTSGQARIIELNSGTPRPKNNPTPSSAARSPARKATKNPEPADEDEDDAAE